MGISPPISTPSGTTPDATFGTTPDTAASTSGTTPDTTADSTYGSGTKSDTVEQDLLPTNMLHQVYLYLLLFTYYSQIIPQFYLQSIAVKE